MTHWLGRTESSNTGIQDFCEVIRNLGQWPANTESPCAQLRVIVADHLIVLEKCPGVRPAGIGDNPQRMLVKYILKACGKDITHTCCVYQLCLGLGGGIEGGIHEITSLWEEHQEELEWGVLLVDASNPFNKIKCTAMMWHVRHMWIYGSRFIFNTYWHWELMVLQGCDNLFHIKEGITQVYPLAMLLYGLSLLPIIQSLKNHVEDNELKRRRKTLQVRYNDESALYLSFSRIKSWFTYLSCIVP